MTTLGAQLHITLSFQSHRQSPGNSATHESATVPVGRDRKIRTALRTDQTAGFVAVPSKKKMKHCLSCHIDNLPSLLFRSVSCIVRSLNFSVTEL